MIRKVVFLLSALCLLANVVIAKETEDDDDSTENNVVRLAGKNVDHPTRIIVGAGAEEGWGYSGDFPPEKWSTFGNPALNKCGGKRQSPVNIDTRRTVYRKYPSIHLDGYNKSLKRAKVVMSSTGAGYTDIDDQTRSLSGGPLNGTYRLAGFHIHWGDNSHEGSEHTINRKAYAMELHMVHYKLAYRTLDQALKHGDGVAVLGVVFEEHHDESEESARRMAKQLSLSSGTTNNLVEKTHIKLEEFIKKPKQFYYYQGSLTTPMCNEAVQWIVFPRPVRISTKQMNRIRTLRDPTGHTIEHNFRPVQDINDRTVYESF